MSEIRLYNVVKIFIKAKRVNRFYETFLEHTKGYIRINNFPIRPHVKHTIFGVSMHPVIDKVGGCVIPF